MRPLEFWSAAGIVVCIFLSSASHGLAAEEAQRNEQRAEESSTDAPSLQAAVEEALVRYLQVSKEEYAPGYLSTDGVFYKFRAEEPLKAEQLPSDTEERAWRVVTEVKEVVEVARPTVFSFVELTDGLAPLHLLPGSRTALLFVGFGAKPIADLPSARGPISGRRIDHLEDILAAGYTVVKIKGRKDTDKAHEAKDEIEEQTQK